MGNIPNSVEISTHASHSKVNLRGIRFMDNSFKVECFPKSPCPHTVYKVPNYIGTTSRPQYILFGYMDPKVSSAACQEAALPFPLRASCFCAR